MDCRKFEEIAGDLPNDRLDDRLMLAGLRNSALIHAAVCERCGSHLAAQRALTATLTEFAEATGTQHASPRVKQRLRAAVAERRPVNVAPVIAMESFRKPRWQRWALAAAAAVLLFFAITIAWMRGSRSSAGEDLVNISLPAPAPTQVPQVPLLSPSTARRNSEEAPKVLKAPPRRRGGTGRAAEKYELASEFVPLTLAADERALENGTLVRMAVPRSRLVAMGLPLHLHGGQETINTEVMLGDNGVAYAIRVVR